MSTPRQEGLESEVYAVEKEAARLAVPSYIDRAHDLEVRLKSQWFPLVTASGIRTDTEKLADEMAVASGVNVLDTTDVYGPVGTAQQEAFVGGDVTANLQAASDDVTTTVVDEAHAVGNAAAAVGQGALSGIKWLVLVVVAGAIVYLLIARKV